MSVICTSCKWDDSCKTPESIRVTKLWCEKYKYDSKVEKKYERKEREEQNKKK